MGVQISDLASDARPGAQLKGRIEAVSEEISFDIEEFCGIDQRGDLGR